MIFNFNKHKTVVICFICLYMLWYNFILGSIFVSLGDALVKNIKFPLTRATFSCQQPVYARTPPSDRFIRLCTCAHFIQRVYITNVRTSGEERGAKILYYMGRLLCDIAGHFHPYIVISNKSLLFESRFCNEMQDLFQLIRCKLVFHSR